ncbi:MAG: hypothetical protein SynsKO_35770 [Synoicihabitans sp.]
MKSSLVLFTIAAAIPAFVFVGLSAPIALSATAVIGVAAMLSHDYGRTLNYDRMKIATRVTAKSARSEAHPLAA